MKSGPLREKSMCFALRIIKLYQHLAEEKKEYVMSKQILRSGTAIGALHRESECAESKPDFIHKLGIAQKECNETFYWLELLNKSGYLEDRLFQSILSEGEEIYRIITASIKTAKSNLKK